MRTDGISNSMIDVNGYNPVSNANSDKITEEKAAQKAADAAKSEAAAAAKSEAAADAKTASEVYGDVLSVSDDGDVATATKQSMRALSDGIVMPKEKAEEEIDSLTGFTASQLDTLYSQGKISKYDYDREVERRDDLKEQSGIDTVKADATSKTTATDAATDATGKTNATNATGKTNATGNTSAAEKPDTRENAQKPDTRESAQKAAIIEQEIDSNNAISKQMAGLSEVAANNEMTFDAINTAKENGRIDLMNQILGIDK